MISMDKKYRTRDGREVRIYAVDGAGSSPIHGAAKTDGQWKSYSWSPSGNYLQSHEDFRADLVEIKTKHVGFINIYGPLTSGSFSAGTSYCFKTESAADEMASEGRLACIRAEWEA